MIAAVYARKSTDQNLPDVTSGGPVVTDDGRLWGIVSTIGWAPKKNHAREPSLVCTSQDR